MKALFEISQGLLFEEDLDFAASGDVDSLNRILTVSRDRARVGAWVLKVSGRERNLPDVGTDDANALEDGEEDGSFESGSPGQANSHERSARAEVVNGLCVTGGASGCDDRRVSTESTSNALNVRNKVLGLLEVDPSLCTEAKYELLLIFPGIWLQTRAQQG
jgi:hypothetical protein